ncbi:hypothetical protein HN51_053446, partial [Arachis hypogaea]
MSKLSLGNIFLFVFLVSVVWMTSIVAAQERKTCSDIWGQGQRKTCSDIWADEDCKRGNFFSDCRSNCQQKY